MATEPFPVTLAEFKLWKEDHERLGHRLLRQDDPRCDSRGLVCIECQEWYKVRVRVWAEDSELSALDPPHALFNERTFAWSAPAAVDEDFSMTQQYTSKK